LGFKDKPNFWHFSNVCFRCSRWSSSDLEKTVRSDDATIDKITELLHEYQDLFPTKFTEMKGIKGPMGEMRIPLKPDAMPVKQRPYRLNPKYKEKVKIELDRMLEAGIIEPVEESEWVSPMVVQDKNIGEIRICVDLRKLNDACLHDPFPTPFTDEVLDNVGGQEVYSFTDGFSGYHQIQIAKEDHQQDHICNRMGILPVYSDAIWLEECTNHLFQSGVRSV
jgi:hypothetical protein